MSRRAGLAAAGVAFSVAAALGAAALLRSSDDVETLRAAIEARPNSLVLLDRDDGRPLGDVPLRAQPSRLAYGEGAFWVAAPEDGVVLRVEESMRSVRRFPVGEEPYDVAVGGGAVWVPDHDAHRLFRLDPGSGRARAGDDLGQPAISVGYGLGSVWLVVASGDLLRIDPGTLDVTRTVPRVVATAENAEPKLVFGGGTFWISSPASDTLVRLDGTDADPISSPAPGILSVAGGEELWVAAYDDRAATRIDGESLRRTGEVRVGAGPVAVAVGQDAVGVAVQSP